MIPEYGGNLANIADIRDRVAINIARIFAAAMPCGISSRVRISFFNLTAQTSHLDSMSAPEEDLAICTRRNGSSSRHVERSILTSPSCMPGCARSADG
jgi:hypothetical protein